MTDGLKTPPPIQCGQDLGQILTTLLRQAGSPARRRSKDGRPIGYDAEAYKKRNVVERSFNVFKQWRGLATRYDKLTRAYRGGVVLRAITILLKALIHQWVRASITVTVTTS